MKRRAHTPTEPIHTDIEGVKWIHEITVPGMTVLRCGRCRKLFTGKTFDLAFDGLDRHYNEVHLGRPWQKLADHTGYDP